MYSKTRYVNTRVGAQVASRIGCTAFTPVELPAAGKSKCAAFTLVELPAVSKSKCAAFTLVELLTVIIIIGLLASILLPTITSAIRTGYTTKTLSQRESLQDGAEHYKQNHWGLYPGQDRFGELDNNTYTGSQILAACVYGYEDQLETINDGDDGTEPDPTGKYAPYKKEYLVTLNSKEYTLSDLFPKGREMAFLYFPCRKVGESATIANKYKFNDNNEYVDDSQADENDFVNFITDSRFTGKPHKDGQFLLIAAGVDRKFFTADDIKNWN